MGPVVLAMLVLLAIGIAVVLLVAVPARREGREVLTAHGEDVVARVKERTETVAEATRERTEDLLATAKDKVGDRLPGR
ncbi:MAG TPA: hypothetical protein P5181_02430 [Dermatophilaceae bacterium]|mgnify:CR=1 FL=1|nr:hypothetical protein [Dermatophilaceae bacterium]